jgi:two-component system sensor histidine kinase TctE
MLAPLLVLWPVSMGLEYFVAVSIANTAYDRELRSRVEVLASLIRYEGGELTVTIPPGTRALLRAEGTVLDAGRTVRDLSPEDSQSEHESFFQVRDLQDRVIAGDPVLPTIEFVPELVPGRIYFADQDIRGVSLRTAYVYAQVPGFVGALLVQVAETDVKRRKLASEISGKVLAAQFIIVPIAIALVWLGLTKGVAPLNELRDQIRDRRPLDLSSIETSDVPEEVKPFLDSINDLMARLSASTQAQRRFIADAAHQMRTPLAGLRTQAELALRQTQKEDVEQTMRQIAISAERASRLINQLLALARAESGAQVRSQQFDLNELVRESVVDWVPRAMDRGIDLGFEPAPGEVKVEGYLQLVRELLNNVIDNALRYTPRAGQVTCRVLVEPRVALEVEDTGIGIEEADRKLVFERFYRVLGTGVEGSGLGLAIVREIAELHGGEVDARPNARGKGTTFVFRFPERPRLRTQSAA